MPLPDLDISLILCAYLYIDIQFDIRASLQWAKHRCTVLPLGLLIIVCDPGSGK